ncbi:MAG: twin-arginine translocase subunit TatC [Elusimicrobiota bacterium]|nr:MAG: twin-arginine translocase subunit TatC [Elusimicrobiota bacterium]
MSVELIPEALPEDEERRLPFWSHIGELRDRLIHSALALAAATALGYFARFKLWELAKRPLLSIPGLEAAEPFAYTDLAEPFFSLLRLSFWTSVVAISPFLFYQVWAFVEPALHAKEKKLATVFVLTTSACFAAGALFAYFVAFPVLAGILLEEAFAAGLRPNLRPNEYLDILLYTVLGTGLSFEAPVLFYFLGRFGLVSSRAMLKYWRESSVAILAAAAFLTPGDVLATTVLFGTVLLALYFVSAGVVALVERRPAEASEI